jgi:hypothetical protein
VLVGPDAAALELISGAMKQLVGGDLPRVLQTPENGLEALPEQAALGFVEAALATEAAHIAVAVPVAQPEGIDDLAELLHHEGLAIDAADLRRRVALNQGAQVISGDALRFAELGGVHPFAQLLHGQHIEALQQVRLPLNQAMELVLQQRRQGSGEGDEQHPGFWVAAGQVHGAVQGHHGLAGAGGALHPGGAVERAAHPVGLAGMQEDDPAFPGVIQRPGQFFGAGEHPEAALGVGVVVGIALIRRPQLRFRGRGAGGEIEDRLGGLTGQVGGDHQQQSVVGGAHVGDPLGGHAVAEQLGFRELGEGPLRGRGCRCFGGGDWGELDLANRFPDHDELGGAGDGMGFELAPRGPVVGAIVMVDIAEHHAALDPMEDQPEVTAGAGGPEVLVLDVVEPVALQAGIGRVDLQLEGGELGGFLLLVVELVQAGLDAVGEEEGHGDQAFVLWVAHGLWMAHGPANCCWFPHRYYWLDSLSEA